MASDFNLSSTQYSIIVLVFFTTYVVCEVPSNMLLNRLRPSLYLPTLAILWGIAAACQGAVTNPDQLIGLRLLIGVFESGFAPGCAFYFSSWYVHIHRPWEKKTRFTYSHPICRYKRYELASRYAWLYTSVAVAGALSGLLAGVITDYMDGTAGLRGWRCKYSCPASKNYHITQTLYSND